MNVVLPEILKYHSTNMDTGDIINRALDLYNQCLKELTMGVIPCYIMIKDDESDFVVNALKTRLFEDGYKVQKIRKTITETYEFYNHTYEISRTFLLIKNHPLKRQFKSKL